MKIKELLERLKQYDNVEMFELVNLEALTPKNFKLTLKNLWGDEVTLSFLEDVPEPPRKGVFKK